MTATGARAQNMFWALNTPSSAIAYTGNQCSQTSTSGSSTACTLTVAHSGDTIPIALSGGTAFTYSSGSAGCGSVVALPQYPRVYNSGYNYYVLYIPNAAAGSGTITLHFAGSVGYPTMQALDFANANTVAPVDNASCTSSPYCVHSAAGTSPFSSGAITTSGGNEMVVSFSQIGGATTYGAGGGAALVQSSATINQVASYQFEATPGTYTALFTTTTTGPGMVAASIALKQ